MSYDPLYPLNEENSDDGFVGVSLDELTEQELTLLSDISDILVGIDNVKIHSVINDFILDRLGEIYEDAIIYLPNDLDLFGYIRKALAQLNDLIRGRGVDGEDGLIQLFQLHRYIDDLESSIYYGLRINKLVRFQVEDPSGVQVSQAKEDVVFYVEKFSDLEKGIGSKLIVLEYGDVMSISVDFLDILPDGSFFIFIESAIRVGNPSINVEHEEVVVNERQIAIWVNSDGELLSIIDPSVVLGGKVYLN